MAHPWPGNVRELRNGLERALLLADGPLRPEDLFHGGDPGSATGGTRGGGELPFPATLDVIERAAAEAMLARVEGNKSAAADALGISRSRLYRLLDGEAEGVSE
jgi:two-component system NtrC family response regulator